MTPEKRARYWREQSKKYYAKNKKKKLEAVKKYQEENKEKVLAYIAKW